MTVMLPAVVVPAAVKHTASMIFLHGLGDSGHGWSEIAAMFQLRLPHTRFIFPHAPTAPVTLNGGYSMPSWYDIISLSEASTRRENVDDLEKSRQSILRLIENEVAAGIPSTRIILGGFSQGGAVTLYTLLKSEVKLAAAVVLSSYLPCREVMERERTATNQATPVFMAHGTADPVVAYEYGHRSAEMLKDKMNIPVHWKSYSGMPHSSCNEELMDVLAFIEKQVPPQ